MYVCVCLAAFENVKREKVEHKGCRDCHKTQFSKAVTFLFNFFSRKALMT